MSLLIKRFQAAVPATAHSNDKAKPEVQVFRLRVDSNKAVRFERMSARELAMRSAVARLTEDREDRAPTRCHATLRTRR